MASALQKLFRRRLSKQQHGQEQQEKQQRIHVARSTEETKRIDEGLRARHRMNTQPYLTVSSLNSPSSSSSHFPFSSKLSLDQFSITSGTDGTCTPAYNHPFNESSGSSARNDAGRSRSVSFSAQSMLRNNSDSGREWSSSAYSEEEPRMDQFGALMSTEQMSGIDTEREDDDLDSNVLYNRLSRQAELKLDWNAAKLILLPSKTDDLREEDLNDDCFVALHALTASNLFKDQYVSVRSVPSQDREVISCGPWSQTSVTATLDTESKTVHLVVSDAPGQERRIEHKVQVRGETTIYRTLSVDEPKQTVTTRSALKLKRPAMIRRERVRIRILFIAGFVIPHRLSMQESEELSASLKTLNVRGKKRTSEVDQADGAQLIAFPQQRIDVPWALEMQLSRSAASLEESNKITCVPPKRQFLQDLLFMLQPPTELQHFKGALQSALFTLIKASKEFTQAYVYVAGFDAYNSSRIRRGILSKAWQAFEAQHCDLGAQKSVIVAEDRARLIPLMENVVMGFCHGKVFTSICNVFCAADEIIDTIVSIYLDKKVTLEDLKVDLPFLCRRPALLEGAIEVAKSLGGPRDSIDDILEEIGLDRIEGLNQDSPNIGNLKDEISSPVRTPLDILECLQSILEVIGDVAVKTQRPGQGRNGLATDDLIPILAFVLIQAGVKKLASSLYYVRQFGVSDVTSSQKNWTLVTNEAVLEYLRKDPLQLCGSRLAALNGRSSSMQLGLISSRLEESRNRSVTLGPMERERRNSLPSNVLFETVNTTKDRSDDVISPKPKYSSSASVFELRCGAPSPSSDQISDFKMPGVPASLYNERSRSRLSLALTSVGEDGAIADETSVLPAHSYRTRRLSRRTTSMSGTSDLLIRPQIVVRSHRSQSQRLHNQSKEMLSSSLGRSLEHRSRTPLEVLSDKKDQLVIRTLSLGGAPISRDSSRESTARMSVKAKEGNARAATGSIKQLRRKSLDAWSTFSLFSDQKDETVVNRATADRQKPGIAPTASTSPTMQRVSTSPTLSSPSFSWLPTWSHDWGVPIRKDNRRGQEVISPVSTSAKSDATGTSDFDSRPNSQSSQSHKIPLQDWSFPHSSSANSKLSSLCPSSPSLSTCKQLESDNTAYSDHTTTVSITQQTPTLSSDAASSFYSPANSQASSSHRQGSRKRKDSRIRLLSVASPAQPLPPKVFEESALSGHFALHMESKRSGLIDDTVGVHSLENGRRRLVSKTDSSTLAAILRPSQQYLDLQSPTDQSAFTPTNRGETSTSINSLPPPRLGRLQLPTPIDERSDPMITFPVAI